MYGVVNKETGKLISRHRTWHWAEGRGLAESLEANIVVVELQPVPSHRKIIGHYWPPIGSKITEDKRRTIRFFKKIGETP